MKVWCLDYSQYTDAILGGVASMVGVPFSAGVPLAGYFPEHPSLEIRSLKKPGDYFKAGPVHVVSRRLRDLLVEYQVRAEFLDLSTSIRGFGAGRDGQYYLFNLMESVDCLDRSRSVFVDEKGYATDIQSIEIISSSIGDDQMFRVEGTIPSVFLVKEELAREVARNRCVGVKLVPINEWRDPQRL